jgi:uncharacterized membrane protein
MTRQTANSDVNKSKLIDNISNLLILIFCISLVAWIIQVIMLINK